MKPPSTATGAFQTSEDTPTVAFYAAETVLALPYYLLRSLHFEDREIQLVFNDYEVAVRGTTMAKLWRELCAYRVREIVATDGTANGALGGAANRCAVAEIEIKRKDEDSPGD